MGDIADAMLDGTLCQTCGEYMDPLRYGSPLGVPRSCHACRRDAKKPRKEHKEDGR